MKIRWWHFLIIFCVTIAILGLYFYTVLCFYPKLPDRGQFGDMFGAVSSLFTACGFGALLLTIWQQNNEAIKRDQEAEDERKLLIKNTEAMTASSLALTKQLSLMAASTKLSALPHLTETLIEHINKQHGVVVNYYDCGNIATYDFSKIDQLFQAFETLLKRLSETTDESFNSQRSHFPWFNSREEGLNHLTSLIDDLRRLHKYKSDAIRLYDEV
jgi:hypothetical protein